MQKAYTYQLLFNLQRPNTYKENKTPWQLAVEKITNLDKRLFMIPPVDLDQLLNMRTSFFTQGGNNLLTDPSLFVTLFLTFYLKYVILIWWSKLKIISIKANYLKG